MNKKILSIILVLTMLISMVPLGLFSAFAAVDPATCEHTYEKHICTKCERTEEIYGYDEYKSRWVDGYDINGNHIYISKFYNASSRPVIFSNPEYILRDTKDPNVEKAFELIDFRRIWPIEVVAEQPDAVIDFVEIKVVGFWGDEKWTNGYKEPIGNVDILSVDNGTIKESGQIKGGEIIHIYDVNSRELTISWNNTLGQFPDRTWPLAFGEYTVHYKGIVHDYTSTIKDNIDKIKDNGDGTHSIQCIKCDRWSDPTPHTMENGVCTICQHAHEFEYSIDYSAGTHTAKCKNCPETQGPVSHSYVNHYCVCGDREYYTTSELFRVDDIYRYENGEDPMCYKQTHFKVKVYDDFYMDVLWIGEDGEPETITISSIDPSEKIQRVELDVCMCEDNVQQIATTSGKILEDAQYNEGKIWRTIHLNDVNAPLVTLSSPNGSFYAVGDIKVFSAEEHQFTNILKDNYDGTHSIKCIGCDETNGVAVAHSFNNGVCACGAFQHTHDYDVTFTFAQDGKTATANISCKVDGCTFTDTKDAIVTSAKTKDETCHSMGETTYTASYTIGGTTYTDTKTVADIAMSGHDYDVTFTFTENGKTATANISCKADGCTFTDTKNAAVTSEKTKTETCYSMGETTYTASYTIGGTTYTDTKTVADVAMSGHDYNVEIYFACDLSGNEVAFAYITCKTPGCTFSDEKEATITSEITKQPTFDAKGETTYTGSYTIDGTTYTNTETLANIPKLLYADYTAVNAAIAVADALDSKLYTPASWSDLETAINSVITGLDSSKQALVDAMAAAINAAISALEYKDADYSAVTAAKASVPSDLSIYTDASVEAVNTAVNAVVEGKKINEQAAVNAMAQAINTAVAALVLKDADYSAVETAIAAIPENLSIYTDASVEAVNAAVNAVVEGKKINEQAAVDAMAQAINTAVAALVLKDADYSAVDTAKANVPSDLSIYTDESVASVTAAVNAVVEGKKITEQAAVDAMAQAINTAVAALVLIDADYSAVDAAKVNVPSDLSIYTDESVAAVTAALNAVVEGKKITEQAAVDAMATAINGAVAALVLKDADYTAVNAAKANIPSDLSIYTDVSVAAVTAAVNAVVTGKKITEQTAVDAMATAINAAVAGLVLKDADYSAVNEAITKADALNEEDYTAETWEVLETALDAVVTGKKITAQAAVDAMAQAIEDALANLKFVEVVKETKIDIADEESNPTFEKVTDEGITVKGNFTQATEEAPAGFIVSGDGTDVAGEKSLTFTAPEGWVIVGVNFDVVYVKSNDRDTHECDIKVTNHDVDVLSMDSANLHFEKSFLNSVPAPAPKMAPGMVKAAPKALPPYGVLEATIEVDTYNAKCLLNNAEVILARIGKNVDLLPTATESALAIIELAKENAKSEAAKAVVVPEDAFAEATTVAEVNAIMATYLAKIALEEYKFEAIKEINALLTENSTEEEKTLVALAIEAIMAATSIEEVDAAKADFYTKWNAPQEDSPDGDCPKIVTGFCFSYRAYKDVPVIGAFITIIHKLIHIFHEMGDSTHIFDR